MLQEIIKQSPLQLLGTLRSTTAKLWYCGCNRKRLRRLPPKLELIKFCRSTAKSTETRCKQIRLGSKFFSCGIPQDFDYFYNTRFCEGISHLHLEIVCHVMIQSYKKYCRVDLTYDSC